MNERVNGRSLVKTESGLVKDTDGLIKAVSGDGLIKLPGLVRATSGLVKANSVLTKTTCGDMWWCCESYVWYFKSVKAISGLVKAAVRNRCMQ
jgi:hypothetical protein